MNEQIDMRTPYQCKPFYHRWALWLRYMPLAYFAGVTNLIGWVLTGAKPFVWESEDGSERAVDSRKVTAELIWTHAIAMPEVEMGHYYTMEQVLGDLDDETDNTLTPTGEPT